MLRRKLLLTLGPLIVMMLAAALWAIALYESAVDDLSESGTAMLARTAAITNVEDALAALELRLLAGTKGEGAGDLQTLLPQLEERVAAVEYPPGAEDLDVRDAAARMAEEVRRAEGAGPDGRSEATAAALQLSMSLRHRLARIAQATQEHHVAAHETLVARLRWWAFALGLAFLVVINGSVIMIIRAAVMVLRPVDELVEASRHLAREEFDYRVDVSRHDEFGELAQATNAMAEQLAEAEQRRLEVLRQVARTLSHELNNAISVIDLQLRLATREREGLDTATGGEHLRRIDEALRRMSATVASLSRIRRVVLTDYVGNVQMVDLERSAQSEESTASAEPSDEIRAAQ